MSANDLDTIRAQHEAIDWCLARLAELDKGFRPSRSPAWPGVLAGARALKAAEHRTTPPRPPIPRQLFHRMGGAILSTATRLEDEGDRVYLGSTNQADSLRDLHHAYVEWCCESGDAGDDIDSPPEE
jgi:hypothetical protein